MYKRLSALMLAIALLFTIQSTCYACNESQTNTYVTQILFGENASSKINDEKVKVLLNALYLCCEQSDNQGQDKLAYLKEQGVSGANRLSSLNIEGGLLLECSHNTWEHEVPAVKRNQSNRKRLLQNAVNKVFDFGFFNNLFGSGSGKCNSLAAVLYYSHLLSDYLADDPEETRVTVNGREIPPYSGEPYISINGGKPSFTREQKQFTEYYIQLSELDELNRCGAVFAVLCPEGFVGPQPKATNYPDPTAWRINRFSVEDRNKLKGMISTGDVYNRCHLVAKEFCGINNLHNLITGTRYLNETMRIKEQIVKKSIDKTRNHVLYRVTPIYKGDNLLASGVQMEAFSVEDNGAEICFNIYCYNVQPGIDLNYANGDNSISDMTIGADNILPFVSEQGPDLISEMNKHLEILFSDQKSSATYTTMQNKIKSIADEARAIGNRGESYAQCYAHLKKCEYDYLDVLTSFVPQLLQKESFFTSAFE